MKLRRFSLLAVLCALVLMPVICLADPPGKGVNDPKSAEHRDNKDTANEDTTEETQTDGEEPAKTSFFNAVGNVLAGAGKKAKSAVTGKIEEIKNKKKKDSNDDDNTEDPEEKIPLADKLRDKLAENKTKKAEAKQRVKEAQEKPDSAKNREQSTENKMLGGMTMAATGLGGMQLGQGLAEKLADDEASAEMKAYLGTIKCGIAGGPRNVGYNAGGETPMESVEMANTRLAYMRIARDMKNAKEALGMAPGIESEAIIDTSSLYEGGADAAGANRFDTVADRVEASKKMEIGSAAFRATAGGAVAGIGVIGGAIGNAKINGDKDKKDDKKDNKK